ncbi:MAG: PAS domain S-box protein, partial [Planctomycetes bacterium]|nr:PAS domain S-box protein [Planctomycetota bacterium]
MEERTGMGEVKQLRSKVAALEQLLEVSESVVREQSAKVELALEKFRGLLECVPDGIIIVDRVGRIVLVNYQVDKLFGYRREDLLGKPVEILLPEWFRRAHEEHRRRYAAKPEARPQGNGADFYGLRRDGSAFPVEVDLSPFKDEEGELVLAAVRDITVRKQIEEELRCARQLAEAASRAKSEFLANMSHEIRTPMNGVIGMTSLLLETSLTREQREFTETIRGSGETLLAIINDILDFSKIEAGRLALESIPFDLRGTIEEVTDLLGASARGKGLDLLVRYPDATPSRVVGDPCRVRQLLLNLAGNAIKFTERGHVLIEVRCDPEAAGSSRFTVSVEDTGIGIPPERLSGLFEVFSQMDVSTTRKYGGTGLGLAISKRLVQLMGGRIWVKSAPGEGSTFSFALTLPVEAGTAEEPGSLLDLAGIRVLVVDDNEVNRRLLEEQLGMWGLRVSSATSGAEALGLLREAYRA